MSFRKGVTFNPLSWLGWLIRLIARVKYNHVAVLFNINDVWFLQEAIGDGVVTKPFLNSNAANYYTHYSIEEYRVQLSRKDIMDRILKSTGIKYDFAGLLFYQLWFNLFRKWIGSAVKGKEKFYCYEHVAYVFGFADSYKIVPKTLNENFIIIKEGVL